MILCIKCNYIQTYIACNTEKKITQITLIIHRVIMKYGVDPTINVTPFIYIVILNNSKFYCPFAGWYSYIVLTDVKLVYKNT